MDLEWTHETCKFVMLAQKKCMPQHTKKCKYIQKLIEMIFHLYEIYNVYETKLWFNRIGIGLWTGEQFDNYHIINELFLGWWP